MHSRFVFFLPFNSFTVRMFGRLGICLNLHYSPSGNDGRNVLNFWDFINKSSVVTTCREENLIIILFPTIRHNNEATRCNHFFSTGEDMIRRNIYSEVLVKCDFQKKYKMLGTEWKSLNIGCWSFGWVVASVYQRLRAITKLSVDNNSSPMRAD